MAATEISTHHYTASDSKPTRTRLRDDKMAAILLPQESMRSSLVRVHTNLYMDEVQALEFGALILKFAQQHDIVAHGVPPHSTYPPSTPPEGS